jgi:glucokinase
MNKRRSFIGLDVGGTNLKVIAFAPDGTRLAEQTAPTDDDGTKAWLERTRTLVHAMTSRCPAPPGIGVAAPGLTSSDGRSIAFMPNRLAGLEGLNWQHWLNTNASVPVFNDAKAALIGEVWRGAARGSSNIIMLTLGTGVGGAAMVDGRVLHGNLGRAGHLGHISLDPNGTRDIVNTPGSLEDAIGECTLPARSKGRFQSTRELVAAFREGSAEAKEIWLHSIRALAAALASFINVLDPEVIVIGGGIADADEVLFQPLRHELDQFEWRPGNARVRVVKAALGSNAGATGAAYGAMLDPGHEPPAQATKLL